MRIQIDMSLNFETFNILVTARSRFIQQTFKRHSNQYQMAKLSPNLAFYPSP